MHEWGGGARRAVGLLVKNTNKGWGKRRNGIEAGMNY